MQPHQTSHIVRARSSSSPPPASQRASVQVREEPLPAHPRAPNIPLPCSAAPARHQQRTHCPLPARPKRWANASGSVSSSFPDGGSPAPAGETGRGSALSAMAPGERCDILPPRTAAPAAPRAETARQTESCQGPGSVRARSLGGQTRRQAPLRAAAPPLTQRDPFPQTVLPGDCDGLQAGDAQPGQPHVAAENRGRQHPEGHWVLLGEGACLLPRPPPAARARSVRSEPACRAVALSLLRAGSVLRTCTGPRR